MKRLDIDSPLLPYEPMKTILFALLQILLTAAFLPSSHLQAADAKGSKDHPLLKRVEGSEIIWYKYAKFDEMIVALEKVTFDYDTQKFKESKIEKLTGPRTIIYYKLPGDVSTLEAIKQYQTDLEPLGFTEVFTAANDDLDDGHGRFFEQTFPVSQKDPVLYNLHNFNRDEKRYAVLKGKNKEGAETTITLFAIVVNDANGLNIAEEHPLAKGQTVVRVDVLESKAMAARMKAVKAEEITSTIATTGRMAIYGIYFDTAKSDLKSGSDEALTEIAKAVTTDGGRFLIVGHTDNEGEFAYNQALSQKRAAAVAAELTSKYSVSPDKIIPVGVGMAAPVAPNSDEAGRSKNRRVEVVKM